MYSYNIDSTSLEVVGEIKDLGVIVDSQMSWKKQAHDIFDNARKTMGLMKRILGMKAPTNVECQLYYYLVRSKIEYFTQMWGDLSVSDTYKIERIKRSKTR